MTTSGRYVKTFSGAALRDFLSHANSEFNVAHGFLGVSGLAEWIENNVNDPYVKISSSGKLMSCKEVEGLEPWVV